MSSRNERILVAAEFSFVVIILILGVFGAVFSFQTYPKVFDSNINMEKIKDVDLKEPIVINFSYPMVVESVQDSIKINHPQEVDFKWDNSRKNLYITPKEYWIPGEEYSVKIDAARNMMFIESSFESSFATINYPEIIDFFPKKGQKDVVFDIEDPISATFSKSIDDFKVKFVINPKTELVSKIDPDNKEIQLISKDGFSRGQKYEISVYIRHKYEKDENYKKIYETFFETKLPPPTEWDKDFEVRLDQARKYTEPQLKTGKYIDINTKSQVMVIFEEGKVLDAFLISSGKRGMDTPQGSFQVHNKFPRAWSSKYRLYMPYWMAIVPSGLYGIHELPEWPGGYKEGANHLGTPVSHGCVRLGVGSAEKVYSWAEIGTPVIIHD